MLKHNANPTKNQFFSSNIPLSKWTKWHSVSFKELCTNKLKATYLNGLKQATKYLKNGNRNDSETQLL